MAIGNKLRFDVFKRDSFTCQYCGSHPPNVVLEVDHVHPASKGGKDEINNLVTSCFECNRGKRNHTLNQVPQSLSINIDMVKEREKQYSEYRKLLKKVDRRINAEIDEVEKIFSSVFKDRVFTETFRKASVKRFIASLDIETVKDAMAIAVTKGKDSHSTTKYFCGICWNKIKDNGK